MHVACSVESAVAFEYLHEVFRSFLFCESASLFEDLGQIAAGAVLSNDVAIIRSKKRVDVAQHILMLDFPETVDFSLEHEPRGVVSQGAQLDDLDGYFLD